MKVTFRTNLGSRDAVELSKSSKTGLDYKDCTCGSSVDVDDDLAEVLAQRGLVEPVEPRPKKVKAVPAKPAVAKAKDETTKSE